MAEAGQAITNEQDSAEGRALEQRLTELQINPQQSNELQMLDAALEETTGENAAEGESGNGHHHDTRNLLHIDTIYMEPQVQEYARGREILAKFPDARRIEIASHWKIPELHGNAELVQDWVKVKRGALVLGVKKSLSAMPYERSCDFVAPSHANGCSMACAYCVAPGTLISTPQGQIPVEQIREGSAVLAFDSSAGRLVTGFVSGTACREVEEALEIEVDGITLRVTAEHPIWTRRGWVKAGELTENDEVLCFS